MGEIRQKRGLEKQEGRERHENKVVGLGGAEAGHPDPVPLVNVQLWETRAYKFWRFFESFF